ncbi:MAG: hypothetical protein ACFFD1_15755, partial [Candidatus Thorarchaeota archaeon]
MFSFEKSSTNFFLFLKLTPINPKFNINNLAGEGRIDLLCRVLTNVFFVSNGFRDSNLYVFFQKESILIKFIGSKIKKINPDERSIAGYLKRVFRNIMEGSSQKHEDFLWDYIALEDIPKKIPSGYLLDPEGKHIRELQLAEDDLKLFFLGDHLGLNQNEKDFLIGYQ